MNSRQSLRKSSRAPYVFRKYSWIVQSYKTCPTQIDIGKQTTLYKYAPRNASELRSLNYVACAITTIVAYELVSNLNAEVTTVWRKKWTWVSTVLVILRFAPVLLVFLFWFGNHPQLWTYHHRGQ
ncbi:hypothetical protein PsYK624_005730 [Phanerochaete sordida]|uniref:DUF6533 domain-containing protein n=1 Tax=Phanerochaete sordida TaxID=48140 RepID=A0A9P3FXV4_9APHY|nr:hypothetical protein PsYK624_005730 [Phanerochaete sordida]